MSWGSDIGVEPLRMRMRRYLGKGPKEDIPGRGGELVEERTGLCWELQVIIENSAYVPNTVANSGVTQNLKKN